jgi:RES domain
LPFISSDEPIYRIARKPNPWRAPDWADAHEDKTFGNRFDDSTGYFRVLYAGSTRFTCFLETLARYRKPAATQLAKEFDEIIGADSDHIPTGTIPGSWLTKREIGRALLSSKRFATIYSSEWMAHLRGKFESELIAQKVIRAGEVDFDLALLVSQHRSLTQKIATHVYELGYDGIFYQSRHGGELVNWAIFEPFGLKGQEHLDISPDDIDFQKALRHFDLTFDPYR